jgi:lanosterol synthase
MSTTRTEVTSEANGIQKRGGQAILKGASHHSEKGVSKGGAKEKQKDQKTDYSRWRLKDDRGVQTWHYLETEEEVKEWPQSTADKWYLGLDTVCCAWFCCSHWVQRVLHLLGGVY